MSVYKKIANQLKNKVQELAVDKFELENVLYNLFYKVLFPVCEKSEDTEKSLEITAFVLERNIYQLTNNREDAKNKAERFILSLPAIQKQLYREAISFYDSDPAAISVEEVISSYPGFFALSVYRISHELHKMNVPIIPRLFSEYAHSKVGIDIHPAAVIGDGFFIDHGTGIVIGETTIIGKNVKIYQGVTLGALSVTKDLTGTKRHPNIEDNVVIYAGATILGGETTIGHHSVIGGNVWLTNSVKPHSLVYHVPNTRIKDTKNFTQPINYYI